MPIIVPENCNDDKFYGRLESAGAALISEAQSNQQDLRPAKIGLLNLMPAKVMEATEMRWLQFISHTVLQIEPVLLKFDNDIREEKGSSRHDILKRYTSFSEAKDKGLDALIITGDNQEIRNNQLLPFEDLYYYDNLNNVIEWSENNLSSVIFSCLSSHIALNRRHGIERELSDTKLFGVYKHDVLSRDSELTFAIDDFISSPHSRWGNIPPDSLEDNDIDVIAMNSKAGWLLAEEKVNNCLNVYLQGHPEYWRNDLNDEYIRDGMRIPENYYADNDTRQKPNLSWSNDARAIFANWIGYIYKQYSVNQ